MHLHRAEPSSGDAKKTPKGAVSGCFKGHNYGQDAPHAHLLLPRVQAQRLDEAGGVDVAALAVLQQSEQVLQVLADRLGLVVCENNEFRELQQVIQGKRGSFQVIARFSSVRVGLIIRNTLFLKLF